MKQTLAAFFACAFSVLATTTSADEPYIRRLTLPVILSHPGGDGARWETALVLANAGSTPASLELRYRSATGSFRGEVLDVLAPAEQRIIPDAFAYLRSLGLPLPDGDQLGSLVATFRGLSDPNLAWLSARISTASGSGRAGLSMSAFETGWAISVAVTGLLQDEDTRSNLALFSFGDEGDGEIVLRVTLLSGDLPGRRFSIDVHVAPGELRQLNGVLDSAGFRSGYALIERIQGRSEFLAFATVIDRKSNDPALVLARQKSGFLLEAVDSPAWRTELVLTNLGSSANSARLEWLLPDRRIPFQVTLGPHEQRIIRDLGAFLGSSCCEAETTTRGSIAQYPVSFAAGFDLAYFFLSARVVSRTGAHRYGVAVPGVSRISGSGFLARIFGLVEDGERRSSLYLVNPDAFFSGESTHVNLEIWDAGTGRLASQREIEIPAEQSVVLRSVLSLEAPGVKTGWATLTRTGGNNTFQAFSVVNDGPWPGSGTSDGELVMAQEHCVPGNRPAPALLSSRGGLIGSSNVRCTPFARSDAPWLSRAEDSGGALLAAANTSPLPRAATFFQGGYEVEVLQRGDAPHPLDGSYAGRTAAGRPAQLTVERGDITSLRYEWAWGSLGGPWWECPPLSGLLELTFTSLPVEAGRPFEGLSSRPGPVTPIRGKFLESGVIEGTVLTYACWPGRTGGFPDENPPAPQSGPAGAPSPKIVGVPTMYWDSFTVTRTPAP